MPQSDHQTLREQRAAASRTRPTWQKILAFLALIALAIFSVSLLVQMMVGLVRWARSEPMQFLGFVLFLVVILVVVFLSSRFERVDRSVSRALSMFGWFVVYWLFTSMP